MVNKMITLPEELYFKLKKEDNASGLIQELLIKHYGNNRSEEDIIQDVKNKIIENKNEAKRQARQDKASEKLKKAIEGDMNND